MRPRKGSLDPQQGSFDVGAGELTTSIEKPLAFAYERSLAHVRRTLDALRQGDPRKRCAELAALIQPHARGEHPALSVRPPFAIETMLCSKHPSGHTQAVVPCDGRRPRPHCNVERQLQGGGTFDL
jgi:hypothetical protein